MYELQEFEKTIKEKRGVRGSLRKALEDGKLHPIAIKVPKMVERRRRDRCGTVTKVIIIMVLTSLIGMLCYAVWRIRDIEKASEMSDYEYRIIGNDEIGSTDENVEGT